MNICDKWKTFPEDIIKKILEYNGTFKMRNGKWMMQIPKNDIRYNILLTIPPKKHYTVSVNSRDEYRETYVLFSNKKYQIFRIENDIYFDTSAIIHYFYCNNAYVLHFVR
jgi:hypothetical protein